METKRPVSGRPKAGATGDGTVQHWLRRTLSAFSREKSGSVLIFFGLALIAIFLIVGLALDYNRALSTKGVLDTATDAAALAALSAAQADYAANAGTTQMVADAQSAAQRAFVANAGSAYSLLNGAPTVSVQRSGQVITANISYQAQSPNVFGALANVANMNISHSAASSLTLPSYLNFYLLLDVSGSMGIPSTDSEQTRLAAINPDFRDLYPGGCTIACHFNAANFPNQCDHLPDSTHRNTYTTSCQGYNLSRTAGQNGTPTAFCSAPGLPNCIQLRLDAVAYAVQQLGQTAYNRQVAAKRTNLFGIGIYPFAAQMATYLPLTFDPTAIVTIAPNITSLIDSGGTDQIGPNNQSVGSGGTHFENALSAVNTLIPSAGDGSSPGTPAPFVFLVTDGAQDNQYQIPTRNSNGTWSANWSGSNNATTLNTANCTAIKNRGITLAVLEIPYVPIQNPTTIWNNEDGAANANAPLIPPVMQSCASPGFYFSASTPTDINNAMQAMFNKAVSFAHLTQ